MVRAIAIAAAAIVAVGCSKSSPPEEQAPARPTMSVEEAHRARDACAAYVEQACACAKEVPALAQECKLARGAPEAVQLALDIAARPDSSPQDAAGALASVRKTVKNCIESAAKLPAAGCR